MAQKESAIKELEGLFSTVAKGDTVYFNDINYTPLPLHVVNAVKLIMEEYPEVGYQIGLYSVRLWDKTKYIKNSMSKKKEEIKSTAIGDIKDQFALGQIKDEEAITQLTKNGKGKREAKKILEKWKESGVVKSSKIQSSPLFGKFTADEIFDSFQVDELIHTVFMDREQCKNNKCGMEEFSELMYDVLPTYLGVYTADDVREVCRRAKNPQAKSFLRAFETAIENAKFTDKFYNSVSVHKKGSLNNSRRTIKSSLGDYFPVSAEEAEDLNELEVTFPGKSELRTVLEDYFHIYDDYAQMTVQEFDSYLADYFRENETEE